MPTPTTTSVAPVLRPEMLTTVVHSEPQRWQRPPQVSFPIGGLSLHDAGGRLGWGNTEPEPDTRYWRDVDAWAGIARACNCTLLDGISDTPGWCRSSDIEDGYGRPGGGSMPTDLQRLTAHAFERTWRFNGPSPANRLGRQLVRYFKAWNEPVWSFEPVAQRGDWQAMADVVGAIAEGVREADRRVVVTTPSMPAGHIQQLAVFLSARTSRGVPARNLVGALAVQAYGHDYAKFEALLDTIDDIRRQCGVPRTWPLLITEAGRQPKHGGAFLDLDEDAQAREWANVILLCASRGVVLFNTYSLDAPQSAEDSRELYPIGLHPGWAAYARILAPHVGHQVHALPQQPDGRRVWRIGNRKVVI